MNGEPVTGPSAETAGHRLSDHLTIGGRVVVRYRLEEGAAAAATDVVGELVARNRDVIIVDTRTERVKLLRADIIAAKDVPPPASKAGPAHRRVSDDDLERLMAKGWEPTDRASLGGWLLRAASGYTGRANSVLPAGDPTLPLERAVEWCERWYAERGQRAIFQVYGEPGFDVADLPVGRVLLDRGYDVGAGRSDWERVLVMTALSAEVPPLTTASVPVVADARMSPEWLMTYGEQRTVVPGTTETVLTGSEGLLFLSVRDEASGRLVAIARMAIHVGWAGIFALWVHPEHRRRGIAKDITSAVAMVARENGMPAIYLQVSADNTAAVELYERLGFTVHHEYAYVVQPAA